MTFLEFLIERAMESCSRYLKLLFHGRLYVTPNGDKWLVLKKDLQQFIESGDTQFDLDFKETRMVKPILGKKRDILPSRFLSIVEEWYHEIVFADWDTDDPEYKYVLKRSLSMKIAYERFPIYCGEPRIRKDVRLLTYLFVYHFDLC